MDSEAKSTRLGDMNSVAGEAVGSRPFASRLPWKELGLEDKVERLREVLSRDNRAAAIAMEEVQTRLARLEDHRHSHDGNVLIPIHHARALLAGCAGTRDPLA